jgi:hypothetical protein
VIARAIAGAEAWRVGWHASLDLVVDDSPVAVVGDLAGVAEPGRMQLAILLVITSRTGDQPIPQGAADFDLDLIESRTLDSNVQELTYRATPHV